ncbi:MAG: TatD family hydrolase [Saprospiraceae bacterium]|nr:TatD family hydrolase [Saprospiraceae bacterium]
MDAMIDTHAHVYLSHFDDDRGEMISRMNNEGVERVYLPNIDIESMNQVDKLVEDFPTRFFPMMGLHPCSVKSDYKDQLKKLKERLYNGNYVGVGEIGIDLYWDKTHVKEQENAYRTQIEWAAEIELPYVVHSRDSLDITIGISEEMQDGTHRGIFHCFNGTFDQAQRIMDMQFLMGIGGVVTFKNAGVDKVVADIPLEFIVLETDAPYLTPAPFRGKRNEPSYLTYIVNRIAEVKKVDVNTVKRITTENAMRLFHPQ